MLENDALRKTQRESLEAEELQHCVISAALGGGFHAQNVRANAVLRDSDTNKQLLQESMLALVNTDVDTDTDNTPEVCLTHARPCPRVGHAQAVLP